MPFIFKSENIALGAEIFDTRYRITYKSSTTVHTIDIKYNGNDLICVILFFWAVEDLISNF